MYACCAVCFAGDILAVTGGYMRTGTGTGVEVHPETPRFFVTGACGQIGQEIIPHLRSK